MEVSEIVRYIFSGGKYFYEPRIKSAEDIHVAGNRCFLREF